jgi:hypothetical protein
VDEQTDRPPKDRDEIAERLRLETAARVRESRKLIAVSKRMLRPKGR